MALIRTLQTMAVMKQVSETGENNAVMQEKALGVSPGGISLLAIILRKMSPIGDSLCGTRHATAVIELFQEATGHSYTHCKRASIPPFSLKAEMWPPSLLTHVLNFFPQHCGMTSHSLLLVQRREKEKMHSLDAIQGDLERM